MKFAKIVPLAAAAIVSLSAAASASTISVVYGNGAVVAAPADTSAASSATGTIQAFNEVSNLTLGSNLKFNGYDIAAGTAIDSHMLFLSPTAGKTASSAIFSFSTDILAVFTNTRALNLTDALLGAAGTAYNAIAGRGLEPSDSFLVVGGDTIAMNLNATTTPGDWVRVITAADVAPVPLPAGALLLPGALALLGAAKRRRKSAA